MTLKCLWSTTRKRKFWLLVLASTLTLGSILESTLEHMSLEHSSWLNEKSKLDWRLTPGGDPAKFLGAVGTKNNPILQRYGSSCHTQINVTAAVDSNQRISLSPPINPGLFRYIRASDKLNREIDRMAVVSATYL